MCAPAALAEAESDDQASLCRGHNPDGVIFGTHAGGMVCGIEFAIEMGADAVDIGKTIHPHPTLGESLGMAAKVAHGRCTALPPAKK